jgi:hypothetical protein
MGHSIDADTDKTIERLSLLRAGRATNESLKRLWGGAG